MEVGRRNLIFAKLSITSIAFAGCLGEPPDDSGDQSESPSAVEYEVLEFTATSRIPDWTDPGGPSPGTLEAFDAADRAMADLDFEEVDEDRRDEVERFVEDTDFGAEFLLYVESEGPNSSYRELDIISLDVEEGTVVGTAEARSVNDGPADDAPMYPSVLVRVTPDEGWPDAVEITIVDGWDHAETLEVSP